jgi:hypothetical protein
MQLVASNIAIDTQHALFGMIVFNDDLRTVINFNAFTNVQDLVAGINAIQYNPGLTNTLKYVVQYNTHTVVPPAQGVPTSGYHVRER